VASEFPGAKVEMRPSGGGVFEVTHDGKLIFSKKALKRHAGPGEIVDALRAATA
jgi:predicted Rdx family selenoprotein